MSLLDILTLSTQCRMYTLSNRVKFLIILMWLVLLFPQFQSSSGLIFEQILSMLLVSIIFVFIMVTKGLFKRIHIFFIVFYMILIVISIIRGVFDNFIFKDIFELSKPLYLGSFFLLSYSINWDKDNLKYFIKHFCYAMGVICLFGIFESTTEVGNTIAHTLYKDMRGGVQYKAVASFISPYVFASVLLIPTFIYYTRWFATFRIENLLATFFFLTGTILTQSRTVFLSLIITMILFYLYSIFSSHYVGRNKHVYVMSIVGGVCVLSLPLLVLLIENNFKYLYSGLEVLYLNIVDFHFMSLIYSTPSISHRYEQIVFVLENIDLLPIVGVGIGKAVLMPESFYALYLYRVGIVGIIIHFSLIVFSFVFCRKLSINYRDDKIIHCFFVSIQMYLISLPFSYASSALNDQVRSGFIFYIIIGLIFKMFDTIKEKKCS